MQSIGERLEEARKRRGISIREASEATKIRGDFLLQFENNQFDVNLPDIYVRGFLRNYSSFLKIDPEKIVTDYNATLIGETKSNRRDSRELFGRLELPEKPRSTATGNEPSGSAAARHRNEEPVDTAPRPPRSPGLAPANPELGNYVKIGLIGAGGVIALLLIVWLVLGIINSSSGPTRPTVENPTPAGNTTPSDTITLIATGDVWVKVTQVSDSMSLFDGQLRSGEQKRIERRGPVRVAYSQGSSLQVEKNGRTYGMTTEKIGQSTIP